MRHLVTIARRGGKVVLAKAPPGLTKFLSVGVSGLAVHTGVFALASHLGLDRSPAWFAGFCTATLTTWALNRRLTFASTGRGRGEEMLRYALVTAIAQGVSFLVFRAAGQAYPHVPALLFVLLGAGVATFFSYTGQRFFTFSPLQRRPEPLTHAL